MKGLYVYGALLMGMCFVVGLDRSGILVALAVISAALAALGEALTEYAHYRAIQRIDEPVPASLINVIHVIAGASWISTALTAVTALFVTLQP